jgi:hypothetical protein
LQVSNIPQANLGLAVISSYFIRIVLQELVTIGIPMKLELSWDSKGNHLPTGAGFLPQYHGDI